MYQTSSILIILFQSWLNSLSVIVNIEMILFVSSFMLDTDVIIELDL